MGNFKQAALDKPACRWLEYLNFQKLCCFKVGQELACPAALDLVVQFVDVIGYRQKDTLCQYILSATIKIPSKIHIFFDHGKTAFCLDASVHPKLGTILCRDPIQCFLSFLLHDFRDIQPFIPFLHRGLAVVPVNAFFLVRTAVTVLTFIDSYSADVPVPIFSVLFTAYFKPSAI